MSEYPGPVVAPDQVWTHPEGHSFRVKEVGPLVTYGWLDDDRSEVVRIPTFILRVTFFLSSS